MTRVILGDIPLFNILFTAAELFPKECYGSLWGSISNRDYLAVNALTHPTEERSLTELTENKRLERLLEKNYEPITHMKFIGDYHSHPENEEGYATTKLTQVDKDNFSEGIVSVVLSIKHQPRVRKRWSYENKILRGKFGVYVVEFAAYARVGKSQSIQKIHIVCPYLTGIK